MADIITTPSGFKRIKVRTKGGRYIFAALTMLIVVAFCAGFAVYKAASLADLMFGHYTPDPPKIVKFNLDEAKTIQRLAPQ